MSVGLNASQARAKSQQDMIIFDEVQNIMRQVIQRSGEGHYEAYIDDGTYMTDATPVSVLVGTVQDPVAPTGSQIIINDYTVTLGVTGNNLNSIIADINDANIPGVLAGKTEDNYLKFTITHIPEATWTYSIGFGTANASLGFFTGVYTAENPPSVDYFTVWQGVVTDRAKTRQMDQVADYFRNLGYKIERLTNTVTNKTFKWHIYW